MSSSAKDFNHPNRVTLTDADIAGVGQAIMTLTQELWVISDRMRVMEAVLAERGIDISDDIDRYQPDADVQAKLNESGKALVEGVLASLAFNGGEA